MSQRIILLPHPQSMTLTGGPVTLTDGRLIALGVSCPADLFFAAQRARQALAHHAGLAWEIVGGTALPDDQIGLLLTLDESLPHAQGYRLIIAPDRLHIQARDDAGAFYGVMTLAQLLQQHGAELPALVIDDWPDLPRRGVMLDISRDKVPTMDTLYALVDQLASWKINEFQLYTEHTFAYRGHPVVWAKASPMTAGQILALDAYCRERHIDLVPNQNSFGHLHRWLEHEPYLPLAETETGVATPWGTQREHPFSLTPANPDSLTFLEGLYAELLPNFTSRYFNVGCDETFDLGLGRSKALCEKKGKGRVYLDFLLEIYRRVGAHGRTMQFWGDIIGNHPDLVPELPQDAIALEWGYEADHDFPAKCAMFAEAGIPFYVCPGTSSWCSIAGRTANALGNIRSAVENGLKFGARGVLNTDWGDYGHWQPSPVSYLGFAYGAGVGWAFEQNKDMDLPAVLDAFAFADKAGVMGKLAYDLGNAYQQPGCLISHGSVLFWAYHWPLDFLEAAVDLHLQWQRAMLSKVEDPTNKLRETLASIDAVMAPLSQAQMARADADQIREEFQLAADMLKHGARRALLILGEDAISQADLHADLMAIEARYRASWLARNRPGGLADSLSYMIRARQDYAD